MPDITEGLEINGQPAQTFEDGDVNTQGGFEDALGRAVAGEAAPERARDEQGRFVAAEAPPAEPEPQPEPEGEEPEGEEEPEAVSEWQVRYEESQRNYDELRQAYGRQSYELGQYRQGAQPETAPGLVDIEAMVEQHGGGAVVDWATKNAPTQIDEAARAWVRSGDPAAFEFYADYKADLARLEYEGRAAAPAAVPDPTVQQISNERKLTEAFREFRENDPGFESYMHGIGPALASEATPVEIKKMLVDPIDGIDDMRRGIAYLKPYAQLEAFKLNESQEQVTPQASEAASEARKEAVRRTAIVSGSQRLADVGSEPSDGEMSSEQRIAKFKDMFEETSSTDIASGLTINGQPVIPPRPSR